MKPIEGKFSILKIALAIVITFFIIAAIILAILFIIGYYWGQIIQQQVRESMSNPFNFSIYSTPSECVKDPYSLLCKLAIGKQKVEQLSK